MRSAFLLVALSLPSLAQPWVVRPHWSEDERQFWFRRQSAGGGYTFMCVQLSDPRPRPAFDHLRLGRLLHCHPERLPIQALCYDLQHPRRLGLIGERDYVLDLDTYALEPARLTREELTPLAQAGPYATTHLSTSVLFRNRTSAPIQLGWLDEHNLEHRHCKLGPLQEVDQQTYEGQTWLARDLESGALLAVFQAGDAPARAEIDSPVPRSTLESPDRKSVVEVRDSNLWLNGNQWSRDGRPGDEYLAENVFWAPDSSRFLALRTRRARARPFPHPGDPVDTHTVHLFDLQGAQISLDDRLLPNQLALHSVRWRADSSKVSFVYQERGHQHLRLLESDIRGLIRTLAEESSATFVCDSEKYYCGWLSDSQFVWMSERTGFNHLFLVDADRGDSRDLTPGQGVVQQVLGLDPERREVYFTLAEPYYARVWKASLDRQELTLITPAAAQHTAVASPSHRYWVDSWSSPEQPPRVELRTAAGDLLAGLSQAPSRSSTSPLFVAKARDGITDIYGRLYFPRSFRKNKQYPVVEHIYAGPHQNFVPRVYASGRESEQSLADQGYIVVQIDGMGTNGRSKAFHDVCWQNLKDAGLPDRKLWIRAAARRYPQMDLSRVAIYGSSAGGANAVAALIWHSDFYKVAVADCGNHDLTRDNLYWGEQWMGWPPGPQYQDNSNLSHADLLKGRLLLLVGDQDERVEPACTLELARLLKCPLVVVKGGGHCVIGSDQGQRAFREFLRVQLATSDSAKAPGR
ncbi:prolyl oligopeptidase family serine peptidase [bacterium]|nr:prolyl oligopeptidase family serine peptidase [bacterium]